MGGPPPVRAAEVVKGPVVVTGAAKAITQIPSTPKRRLEDTPLSPPPPPQALKRRKIRKMLLRLGQVIWINSEPMLGKMIY